jgi:hypothetical protein
MFGQPTWSTPRPIDTTAALDQEGPLITIASSGKIAIVCREGGLGGILVFYTSSDNGMNFIRHEIIPPTQEHEVYYPSGLAYDASDQLWILWSWDWLVNGLPIAYYLSLSKSTDDGQSFDEIFRNNRGLLLQRMGLILDNQNNVHVLRDSLIGGADQRIVYTRLYGGNPNDRLDTILPIPQDSGSSVQEINADFWTDGGALIHYVVDIQIYDGLDYFVKFEYSRSLDSGISFSPLETLDTGIDRGLGAAQPIVTSSGLLLVTYLVDTSSSTYRYALVSDDSGSSFGIPFQFGSHQPSGDGRLTVDSDSTYAFYSSFGMVYNKFLDPASPPIDTAFFPDFVQGQFSVGPQNDKYIVMRKPLVVGEPLYLFFSSRDVTTSVVDNAPITSDFRIRASPNPFNTTTKLYLDLPNRGMVRLELFDILGRRAFVEEDVMERGRAIVQLNASNLASGLYFARIQMNNQFISTKLLLLR